MRRLALLSAILLLVPAAAAQATRLHVASRPDLAASLATVDPSGALRVVSSAQDGTVRRLAGPLTLSGDDLAARASDFAARFAPLFGAGDTTTLGAAQPRQPRADGSPRAAFLPQLAQGWEVQGAGLMLALDADGRATGAHGWLSPDVDLLGPPTVGETQAELAALAHLGLLPSDLHAQPTAQGIALATPAPALAWRVSLVQNDGLTPWRVDVDAHSGAVLSARRNVQETGHITLDGVPLAFPTLNGGSALVYKTPAKAALGTEAGSSLQELTAVDIDEGLALLFGTLTGRYCTVSDLDAVIQNVFLLFDFSDSSNTVLGGVIVEHQAFDHVNTYYWLSKTATYLRKVTGTLPSDTCIPVIVNFDNGNPGTGFANAFFTTDDLDGPGGFAPGYFLFGELEHVPGGDPMDDFSRDPTIGSHEYFHGMCDFAGLQFGNDDIDTPPRAVNEAIADYASASFHNTPQIGHAFVVNAGDLLGIPGDSLRDLTNEITLPDNLFDTIDPDTDLPEEHEAGKIFGCALWRLRTQAKQKASDNLVINHLSDWPQSSAEVGFPVVTPGNAQAAYEEFDFECFLSLINSALAPAGSSAWKNAAKVLGAGLAHGILGANTDNTVLFQPDIKGKITLNFKSDFLGTLEAHAIGLELTAGQVISIALTGDKADATQPDFAFDDDMGDFTFNNDKVVNPTGTKVSQKNILVNVSGQYILTISSLSGPGAYKASIRIK